MLALTTSSKFLQSTFRDWRKDVLTSKGLVSVAASDFISVTKGWEKGEVVPRLIGSTG